MRILVIEDDRKIASFIERGLREDGYAVDVAHDGQEGLTNAHVYDYDALVVDIMLPGKNGYEIVRDLRSKAKSVPVILLTARDAKEDIVRGLDAGADDYLTKPFSPEELVLRVGAVLRRLHAPAAAGGGAVLKVGPIAIDRAAHLVTVDGAGVELTRIEYRLLLLLAERQGRVQSRAQLLESVWEAHADIQTRTVDMHVQRLRAKLGAAGELIETVRGFGYRLKRGADAR